MYFCFNTIKFASFNRFRSYLVHKLAIGKAEMGRFSEEFRAVVLKNLFH